MKAQTFAIRLTAHHKPHIYTGKSAPCQGSPNNMCLLFLVVVNVRLLSNMSLRSLRIARAKLHKNPHSAACFNEKTTKR